MDQLSLFEPPRRTFTMVTVCPYCGRPLHAEEVDADGGRWDQAEKWGYIAQKAHEREGCPARPG